MAEFHAAGFSEFDKFFGGDSSNDKGDLNDDSLVVKETKHRKGKRGGVGSEPATLSLPSSSTELSKRLLKVGTKRSRNRDDDVEEELENDNRDAAEEDDDEEDAGRTGISSKESSATTAKKELNALPPSKKKKLGKKERQKMKEEEEAEQKEDIVPTDETAESNENSNDTDKGANKRKPKRRKVRSRQKNIRKDNRNMNEKPKHLRVGVSNYQGRPLTDETRTKLNLAPSKSKTAPLFVIDRSPAPKVEEGIALGVEDLLAEPTTVEEKGANKKKKKKKKSKRKYKNL